MKILKSSDRVKVKIGDISLILSPMKQAQKVYMSGLSKVTDGIEVPDTYEQLSYVVKTCVKGIEGVEGYDDKPVVVELGADGCLTEDSHDEIMTIVLKTKQHFTALFEVAQNEVPKQLTDINTGKVMKGVEVTVLPKT